MILQLDERRELRRLRGAARRAKQHLLEMLQARWAGSRQCPRCFGLGKEAGPDYDSARAQAINHRHDEGGCCQENPGANTGCCPDTVARALLGRTEVVSKQT